MDQDLGEIRFLGDMVRLQPQPGDVYVLTSERLIAPAQAEQIRAQWRSVMGDVPCLVLSGGLHVGVLAQPAVAEG